MIRLLLTAALTAAAATAAPAAGERWALDSDGIEWRVSEDRNLPHRDTLEMSGAEVSLIVHYGVNAGRALQLEEEIYWPMIRTRANDVRAYLRAAGGPQDNPLITVNGHTFADVPVARIRFDGILTVRHKPLEGVEITRAVFPSPDSPAVHERWTLVNTGAAPARVAAAGVEEQRSVPTVDGTVQMKIVTKGLPETVLEPGGRAQVDLSYAAFRAGATPQPLDPQGDEAKRREFIARMRDSLVLHTPEPLLDREFLLAKIRAAESVFRSALGYIHSPGGGRYYAGIWANDQVEYAGPFFPFLGWERANEASLNAYRVFAKYMGPDYQPIPSSIEMNGTVILRSIGDRGDAAMYGYGASRFALALGDRKVAGELWPHIAWCLEYCRRKTNAQGVVESKTDEMEGRLPTGAANLSTSTLTYGALRSAARLAAALGHDAEAAEYTSRANRLRDAIEGYFGATVAGYRTYRYYEGSDRLRGWIALPLAMGIDTRSKGTIDALFDRLWTKDGLLSEEGEQQFWDRETLYALRGILQAGRPDLAIPRLIEYTRQRLTGEHVPYPVEAHPDGEQAHLSAESALYCRIFTEGLFGITPAGFRSFDIAPHLAKEWSFAELKGIRAFGGSFDVRVDRSGDGLRVRVSDGRGTIADRQVRDGESAAVRLPER